MALLEARPFRPFKSSEEYLEAMKEDLAEWLNVLYPDLIITADNFMDRLGTGVVLCKHANNVLKAAEDYLVRRQARNKSMTRSFTSGLVGPIIKMGSVHYLPGAKNGTFFARDNVSNFITWCRKSLNIIDCLLFETDDLIMRKNEKHVILCLLEVARRGAKFGMLAPLLVQMERQIDREIAADNKANDTTCEAQVKGCITYSNKSVVADGIWNSSGVFNDSDSENDEENSTLLYGPKPQIVTNDLKSLDEMVRDLVEECTCPSQFPMIRVSEGKYRIGDTKVLIFVRILRSHVMVRVGGGWDTLSHYLDKHDPCRCKTQHRASVSARLMPRLSNHVDGIELHRSQVIFDRSPPLSRKPISNTHVLSNKSNSYTSNRPGLHCIYGNLCKASQVQQTIAKQKLQRDLDMHNTTETPSAMNKKSTLSPNMNMIRRCDSPNTRYLSNKHKNELYNNGPKSLPISIQYEPYSQIEKKVETNSISMTNLDVENNISENSDEDSNNLDKLAVQKQKSLHTQRQGPRNDVDYRTVHKKTQRNSPLRYNVNNSSYSGESAPKVQSKK